MMMMWWRCECAAAAVLLLCAVTEAKAVPSPVEFGKTYHVEGVISLPYAEIKEPFEGWFTAGKASRVDYYHGQVSTYQLAGQQPWGVSYKITPETTEEEVNAIKCFQVNGTKEESVSPQATLPDLQGFQFLRMEYQAGFLCEVWQNVTAVGYKKNTYTMWVSRAEGGQDPPTPVHYEMMGYDTLLGSHYDKYLVDYKCEGFPGPGVEHHLLANPLKDLIHAPVAGHAQRMFGHFKEKYVHSKNRAGLSFALALNPLSDRTASELAAMRGRRGRGKTPNKGLPFPSNKYQGVQLPDSLDWRLYGAVTPVKDQAICRSCWSFSTTGAIEGAFCMKMGYLQVLSQQMLIDCSWGFGNNGCDGGEEWRGYEWIMKHGGLATTETYGPYMGMNGQCHLNETQLIARIHSYTNVTSGDGEALFKNGPVAVSIDASHRSFVFYSHSVYYEPACGSTVDDLDHAVLPVGYGTMKGEPYWLVKNSWSTYWGNDGYVLMSMKDNNCGVATDATFVTLA
ncbi:hypothetical protein CRUP_033770 [Coryphaenoides rupestris]|nr:hypothetical protein CRUP_033770 [Coryphaenoides rupestris]